ncbi:MAG: hypothetical protein IJT73_11215, partial [Selenomonadaceae bacterium]|nr:hypothetical protein [Selenomonadaceae bacterium]
MNNLQTAQAASLKDNPRLAILPYADKASKSLGLDLSDATVVSEFLMEQFLDSARFKIVEREKMQEILAEHSLNASGLVNPATAVGVGKLAGAQFLVAGSVTGLSTKKSGASYSHSGKGGVGFNSYTVIANITLRIIDIEDGSVVMAVSGTGESARTNVDVVLRQEIRHYYGDDGYDDNSENNSSDSSNIDAENNSSDSINTDSENNSSDSSNIDAENNSSDSINTDSENNSSDSSNIDAE